MNSPKISVIVPVYNVSQYLERCFDSIIMQTLKDFEVVVIDDGSTDGSESLCDKYEKIDNRFRVFHRTNHGISSSREFGVQQAKGMYIEFVDSDDWIESDMLLELWTAAIDTQSDIVGCCFIEEYNKDSVKVNTYYDKSDSFRKDVISNRWGVLWKLIIRRQLIMSNNIHFPSGIDGGEDYYYVSRLLLLTDRVSCIDRYLYHYNRTNTASFISSPSFVKLLFQVKATELLEKQMTLEQKDRFMEELLIRKSNVKILLLKSSFLKAYSLMPEVDLWAFNNVDGKRKYFFLICYIINKILKHI